MPGQVGAELLAVLRRRISLGAYSRLLVVGLMGNTAGALVFATLCAAAGGPYLGSCAERAAAVGAQKAGHGFWTALLLALRAISKGLYDRAVRHSVTPGSPITVLMGLHSRVAPGRFQ